VPRRSSLDEVTGRARDHAPSPALLPEEDESAVHLGNLDLDFERYLVLVDGAPVRLTYFQFSCLRLLVQKRNRLVSRAELCTALWGAPTSERNGRLNSQISSLRHQLHGVKPWHITTVPLRGYVFSGD